MLASYTSSIFKRQFKLIASPVLSPVVHASKHMNMRHAVKSLMQESSKAPSERVHGLGVTLSKNNSVFLFDHGAAMP